MLGAGHGRSEQGHLASAYSSGSGRLDTGIVPKLYPVVWTISWLRQVYLMQLTISSICVMRTLGRSLVVRPRPFTSEVNTSLANPG
jgi:hypothetical protein